MNLRCAPIVVQLLAVLFMAPPAAVQAQSLRDQYNEPLVCTVENADYRIPPADGQGFICIDKQGRATRYWPTGQTSAFIGTLRVKTGFGQWIQELHEEDGKLVRYKCFPKKYPAPPMQCKDRPYRRVIGIK